MRAVKVLVALIIGVVPFVVAIPAAFAGVGFGVTPMFPTNVTVGQTGLPAAIQILNSSTPPESAGNVKLTTINMVPACGTTNVGGTGNCPAASADPGVFSISPTGVGEAGTACAGTTFTVTIIDAATGQVTFTPSGGPIVLTPPATANSVCRIDFSFDVLKAPTKPTGVSPPNAVQTAQIGFAAGIAAVNSIDGIGIGSSFVTVAKAQPGITTAATPAGKVGIPITDTATVSAANPPGPAPTGSITFTLFGPNNASCAGPPAFTSTVPVSGGLGSYTSAPFTAVAPGLYRWIAAYSGDANNTAATTACGDNGESSTVSQAAPAIVTTASAPVTIGGPISDVATLSAGFNPTGTITFTVFGPNNPTCTGAPAFTSTTLVSGNGAYASGPFTPTAAGTYRFVAIYTGDANNVAVTSACGAANENTTVNKATPAIVTTASAAVAVGGTISDAVVLSGGVVPTGTITFTVFGPNNPACTGIPAFTSITVVSGNGTYSSANFTTTAAGTYQFVATYSGDANNNAATSPCGAPNESVVVAKATPTIVTTASPSVPAGGQISDTAALSGGMAPTGTITFTLFGPGDLLCTTAPIFISTKPVSGNGVYPSDPLTVTNGGTYNWVALYSGDANNASAVGPCGAANESVVVTKANPAVVTHASASVAAGGAITDTATVSGGAAPTGTITFTVFGPNNPTCSGTAVFTSTVTVSGNGAYTSAPLTALAAGTYGWVASYSGDANNNAATSGCNAANEAVVVTRATPAIVTRASGQVPPPVPVGSAITDTATLSGGANPTGTITFTVFGPDDATCSTVPPFTSTKSVFANGNYPSDPFTATVAGTYRFVAAYSGDANNNSVATLCNDANEAVVVGSSSPTIVTHASPSVAAGGAITDTATLSGAVNATGSITFTLFGANNATCAGAAIFTSTVVVNAGNGSYPSGSFTTVTSGTYRWVAAYSGDANNTAVTTACNDANESVVVTLAHPAIATRASAPVNLGGAIGDTASLTGGVGPTGTITFTAYGPDNAICSGTPVFAATVAVAGNGNYLSATFTPTAPGTYRFLAAYSGDANNGSAGPTACGDPAEAVVVSTGSPTIVTHASAPVTVGGTITDTATLAGGQNPTGTITFQVFGPDNAACSGVPVFTSTKTVVGAGNYTSDPFTVPSAGSYRFVATYSGDASNSPAGPTSCADPNEVSGGNRAGPAIATTVSATTAVVGGAFSDTAILTGGFNPTGTITFNLFGPGSPPVCTGALAFSATAIVSGTGNYTSPTFTATLPGTYTFIAAYSGDTNNRPAGPTACNDPAETVSVAPSTTSISTVASPSADVGQPIYDTATLGGSGHPTGTVTFTLFGPNNASCAGTPVFTSTKAVNGTGSYVSGSFIPTAAGSYLFVAAYSGDANNAPLATPCHDANESVVVGKAAPVLTTAASTTVPVGGAIADTATLSGGENPTGTITFELFGPDNPTCTGSWILTSQMAVTGNGSYTSDPYTTVMAGNYSFKASYSGDANNAAIAFTACGVPAETVTVTKADPAITTHASAPVGAGGAISDTATLAGGYHATGAITFTAFGPDNATCTGPPTFSSTALISGNGIYSSGSFVANLIGTYRFVAAYSGDANNAAAASACNDANEDVVVGRATATIVTVASPSVPAGGTVSDAATLSSAMNPTGSITFTLFGPNNATCTGIPIFTSTKAVSGSGNYISDPFVANAVGTYQFAANYSGDSLNSPAASACGAANESVVVVKSPPRIVTQASPSVAAGGAISDSATLTGGVTPTGTITFTIFGPNNATCTGTPIFTSTKAVSGNGDYISDPFVANAVGSYRFTAAYSGDANNDSVVTLCGDPNETVVVTPASPAVTTTATPRVPLGGTIDDVATLTGGSNPTGTITFELFGPNDATCTGSTIFTSTKPVTGGGSSRSDPFAPRAAGNYNWAASYSGDANNNPIALTPCGVAGEASTVEAPTSIAVTPVNPTVTRGGSLGFTATGTFSDGTTADVTTTATWATSNASVATISGSGVASTHATGTVTVSASVGTIVGSTTLTVAPPALTSIGVTPRNPTVTRGGSLQFTATGTFSDGSTADLTTTATWATSNAAVATISSTGLAGTHTTGTVTVSATVGSIVGSTTLTVAPPALRSITVTPPNPTVTSSGSQQFVATGTFSDGSTAVLTTTATWATSNAAVATISSTGLASAHSRGTVTVLATVGSVVGSTTLTVAPPALRSIAITPSSPTVTRGGSLQFTATGTFSDGSTAVLTTAATWATSNSQVATVGSTGLASARVTGTVSVSATLGTVVGFTTLTVAPPALTSIAVTPRNPTVTNGGSQQFTATGTYSDGTTAVLTTTAKWASSNASVATISSPGLATARAPGSVTISAAIGSIVGSTTLNVTAPSCACTTTGPFVAPAVRPPVVNSGGTSPGGNFIVTATAGGGTTNLAVTRAANHQLLVSYRFAGSGSWGFGPNGQTFAVLSANGFQHDARAWNLSAGGQLIFSATDVFSGAASISFSPPGQYLLYTIAFASTVKLRVVATANGAMPFTTTFNTSAAASWGFGPDGKALVYAYAPSFTVLWNLVNLATGQQVATTTITGGSVWNFSPCGEVVALVRLVGNQIDATVYAVSSGGVDGRSTVPYSGPPSVVATLTEYDLLTGSSTFRLATKHC